MDNKLKASYCTRSIGAAAALMTGLVVLCGCGHKGSGPAPQIDLPAVTVRTQNVETRNQLVTEEVVGTIRAKLHATLEAKLTGRISEMPVLLGQSVKHGELLARLDAAEIKARLDQAQAALEQAERDWKRISALFEGQAVTRSEYDAAEARRRVAAAAVAEAQAMLEYTQVLAPFDGVVTKKWADVGDQATPGKPLLEIEDPLALQLEADVPEAIGSHIERGAKLPIRIDSMTTELTGVVTEIAPAADPVSRTFRVKLDLPRLPASVNESQSSAAATSNPRIMSGQFARLQVPLGEHPSLRIPASAVIQRGQLEIAFVVDHQRAQLHLVKTGKRSGDEVEILSGLDAGDAVVVDGATQLLDGQPITMN